jgi:predicted transcriptional regulator
MHLEMTGTFIKDCMLHTAITSILDICKKHIDIDVRQLYNMFKDNCLKGVDSMNKIKKLPDTEFEVMKVVWANEPPITTNMIMEQLGKEKEWKAPTVISLMLRLVERGFVRTEKNGKERTYFPLVTKKDYLKFETGDFMERFHDNSFTSLVATLYDGKKLKDSDLDELMKWLKEKRD